MTPSAGASGGIVGAFLALFKERTSIVSGMDFVANLTDLNEKIGMSDLVVTGEGSFDDQTLQGKAVAQIIDMCLKNQKQVVVVCGVSKVSEEALSEKYTEAERQKIEIFDLVSRYGADSSLNRTQECLEHLCSTEI